jgi:hypothetical protein
MYRESFLPSSGIGGQQRRGLSGSINSSADEDIVFDFETLDSLPPYGPLPVPFTATGQGTHREGFVVRLVPDDGPPWVGNFQGGWGPLTRALRHPNGRSLVVIAAGQAYVIDAHTKAMEDEFGADLHSIIEIQEPPSLVFVGLTDLKVLQAAGRWNTRRLSWDGFDKVRAEGSRIVGEAWEPGDEVYFPFTVDLNTRAVTGGSYPSGEPR